MATNIHDVCDLIIVKMDEADGYLNLLKLQKLVFYTQALYLAFYDTPLFDGKFQAWVHGPVSRELYDRFRDTKTLYSDVTIADIRKGFDGGHLSEEVQEHIGDVLDAYGKYSGAQLEAMTHREDPWLKAREGFARTDRCEREIDEALMQTFYAAQQA